MRKKRNTNVIEGNDDVDDEDVDNDALPAELGKCSMGYVGFVSPPWPSIDRPHQQSRR